MRSVYHLLQERLNSRNGLPVGKERFVTHAPYEHRRVIAVNAYHLFQLPEHIPLKSLDVLFLHGISTGRPTAIHFRTGRTPKRDFRPKEHALTVTSVRESRSMGIMATANHVKTDFLHHPYVAAHGFLSDSVSPSSMILMYIRPPEKEMLPVQEETFVGRPLKPTETERHFFTIHQFTPFVQATHHRIQMRMRRMPQSHALYFIGRQVEVRQTLRFHAPEGLSFSHDAPVLIQYLYSQFVWSSLVRHIAHIGLYTYR